MAKPFLELHKDLMDTSKTVWSELYKDSVIKIIERGYNSEYIREWGISDLIINGDKVLLKWYKRHFPLSDDDIRIKNTDEK